ncbi:MAG: fibronectin type III domain-containing protein [candidate division Zixibacteria bacterium]
MRTFCRFLILAGIGLGLTGVSANTVDEENIARSVSIRLTWTAPRDIGPESKAAAYDLRFSTDSITEERWYRAAQVSGEPFPEIKGVVQSCYVFGLVENTKYYFAIKSVDRAGNWSKISNVVSRTAQRYARGDINDNGIAYEAADAIMLTNFFIIGLRALGDKYLDDFVYDINADGTPLRLADLIYMIRIISGDAKPLP